MIFCECQHVKSTMSEKIKMLDEWTKCYWVVKLVKTRSSDHLMWMLKPNCCQQKLTSHIRITHHNITSDFLIIILQYSIETDDSRCFRPRLFLCLLEQYVRNYPALWLWFVRLIAFCAGSTRLDFDGDPDLGWEPF